MSRIWENFHKKSLKITFQGRFSWYMHGFNLKYHKQQLIAKYCDHCCLTDLITLIWAQNRPEKHNFCPKSARKTLFFTKNGGSRSIIWIRNDLNRLLWHFVHPYIQFFWISYPLSRLEIPEFSTLGAKKSVGSAIVKFGQIAKFWPDSDK